MATGYREQREDGQTNVRLTVVNGVNSITEPMATEVGLVFSLVAPPDLHTVFFAQAFCSCMTLRLHNGYLQ